MALKLEHREQRIAFEEMLLAVRQAQERIERLEQAMREAVADWTLAPAVEALQAMRGMDMVGAITFLAELGDLSRFDGRERQARRHHQGRKHPRPPAPHRSRMEL